MIEQQLKSFIDVAEGYFRKVTPDGAQLMPPAIHFQGHELMDYTGIIQISGLTEGLVYITAPTEMLVELTQSLGDSNTDPDNLSDLIGEIANTISSNSRRDFGPQFKVSVPKVARRGQDFPFPLPPASFVIPIRWRNHQCELVIALTEFAS
ncbi:MAG: chemotaxis protein CheX [Verrucomicrobiia bacterium]